ncbi:hypothetical protein LEP1GSC058_0882 [Leptospira fainei serovar Hurstbridge str. BUT 6]|uniref:Uncharacterized protein n=1 Tax=Leptospira fainei serovar Hurstbridge str. BUT 6 TaxID=1193011 RepID=S3V872_9LEPT|nr:hypothetical protein [Leptospira fainei]EPG72590.1 hypothetical protein LEP1GSC058_0882 [Leptospira fainei serovar Hurstbridge str. BUT 6]
MELNEKLLYHQIHPLKLCVDFSTGLYTTYLAWHHNLSWFLILFLIPSILITILLIKFADLESLKNSAFGKYVKKYMSKTTQGIRLAGQILMWTAAWFHLTVLIGTGFVVIIGGWLFGLFIERKNKRKLR